MKAAIRKAEVGDVESIKGLLGQYGYLAGKEAHLFYQKSGFELKK